MESGIQNGKSEIEKGKVGLKWEECDCVSIVGYIVLIVGSAMTRHRP